MMEKLSESFRQRRDTVRSHAALGKANERIEELERNERIDPLTKLPNRLAFQEELDRRYAEMTRSLDPKATERRHVECSILALDLDGFKAINDRFGHAAGDDCLRQVAHFVQQQLRPLDFLARFGGDEFMLVLPNTDAKAAASVAERVRTAIRDTVTEKIRETYANGRNGESSEEPIQLSASIGVVSFQQERATDGELPNAAELVKRADFSAYVVKEGGKDGVLSFAGAKEVDEKGEMQAKFLQDKGYA